MSPNQCKGWAFLSSCWALGSDHLGLILPGTELPPCFLGSRSVDPSSHPSLHALGGTLRAETLSCTSWGVPSQPVMWMS